MIPIIRVSHLIPIINGMKHVGAPVDRMLQSARLPTLIHDEPSLAVPETFVWKLCALVARGEGLMDFGFRIAECSPIWRSEPALIAALSSLPTVREALQRFGVLARLVSTGPGYRVDRIEGQAVFCHMNWPDAEGQEQVDLYTLMMMTQTVQCLAGRPWRPPQVVIRPSNARYVTRHEWFAHARIRYGERFTGIVVPEEILASPVRVRTPHLEHKSLPDPVSDDSLAPVRAVLRTYLAEGRPSLGLAAEISGMSERTFQRRLDGAGVNYSQLLDQVRLDAACAALVQADRTITEIAFDLGFTDVSHFTRAFRRWTAMSPRQFRKLGPPRLPMPGAKVANA